MGSASRRHRSPAREKHPPRERNAGPIIIMLVTVVLAAVPLVWSAAINPVHQYNRHLHNALRAHEASRGASPNPALEVTARQECQAALPCAERAFGRNAEQLEDVLIMLQAYAVHDLHWPQARGYGERLLAIQAAKYGATNPRLAPTHQRLAQAYHGLGEITAEETALKRVAQLSSDPAANYDLAEFYSSQRQYAAALPLYRNAVAGSLVQAAQLKASGQDVEWGNALGAAAVRTDQYVKVAKLLGKTAEYRDGKATLDKITDELKQRAKKTAAGGAR